MAAVGKTPAAGSRKKESAAKTSAATAQTGDATGAPQGELKPGDVGTSSLSGELAGAPGGASGTGETGETVGAGATGNSTELVNIAGGAGGAEGDSAGGAEHVAGSDAVNLHDSGDGGTLGAIQAQDGLSGDAVHELIGFPSYPRLVEIVNDTPIPYVVARHHVEPNSTKPVAVDDEGELVRMRTDCAAIMSLSDHYKDEQPPLLRVVEVE